MAEDRHLERVRAISIAFTLLSERGPLKLDDLDRAIADEGLDVDIEEVVDELVDEFTAWHLAGHLFRPAQLLTGRTFTKRVDAEELTGDYLSAMPDLAALLLDERALGQSGRLGSDDRIAGPRGWLPEVEPGQCVRVDWLGDGRLVVEAVRETSGDLEVRAISAAFDDVALDGAADVLELVAAAMIRDGEAFRAPVAPLRDLIVSAGLELRDDEVARAGFDWADRDERRRERWAQDLASQFGLSRASARHLAALSLGAVRFSKTAGLDRPDDDELAEINAALGDGDAVHVFLSETWSRDLDAIERLELLAEEAARHSGVSAGWVMLEARAAELRGNGVEHAAAVDRALRIDPAFVPALDEAAWALSERGDARASRDALTRLGADESDARWAPALGFSAPAFRGGRNDPCPCGSGRKYKHCCVGTSGYSLYDRLGWLHAKLHYFAERPAQREELERFAITAFPQFPSDLHFEIVLHDDTFIDLALFADGLVERFIEERGALLPADERELLEAWRDEGHRLLAVERVEVGEGATLRDVVSGELFTVRDTLASVDLAPATHVLHLVLPAGDGRRRLAGVGLHVPDGWVESVRSGVVERDVARLAQLIVPLVSRDADRVVERFAEVAHRMRWMFPGADPELITDMNIKALVEDELCEVSSVWPDDGVVEVGDERIEMAVYLELHEIVAEQVIEDDPPQVWATAQRLARGGHSHTEVMHTLVGALQPHVHGLIGGDASERDAYVHALAVIASGASSHPKRRHDRRPPR